MDAAWGALVIPGALIWLGAALAPWRPWSTRERLEPDVDAPADGLSAVTVLIPARNEAVVIGQTLEALQAQGPGLKVLVIDDESDDGTAQIARAFPGVSVLRGQPLASGWAGKLWALEQGRLQVKTPLTLLLDADIALLPGMLPTLLAHKRKSGVALVSIMARLRMDTGWDRALTPAFVYFFKLLYPFAVSNSRHRLIAAAAGGCILVDTEALEAIGAFTSLRGALIDDCTLARRIKQSGRRTWIGLSQGVLSLRAYGSYAAIHAMVARSAFTQLRYSTLLLLAVTAIFAWAFWFPIAGLFWGGGSVHLIAAATLLLMASIYVPTLRYYRLAPARALLFPGVATIYIGMTWSSALRYWRGLRSQWKGRDYTR
jgi:hopene-associated glycosyltransferase HpnB